MYGWFEPGGSINKFFINTKMNDVLLRTSTMSNVLVLGNTNATSANANIGMAGVYICQNSVGIQRIPDPRFSLDVAYNVRAGNTIECGTDARVVMSASNISLSSNVLLTTDGLVRNSLTITNHVKTVTSLLLDQHVVSFTANMDKGTFTLQLVPSPDLEAILVETFLEIQGIMFRVVTTVTTNTFEIRPYFPNTVTYPLPFTEGSIVNIQLLQDLAIDLMNTSRTISWFTISSYAFYTSDSWTGNISFVRNQKTGLVDVNLTVGQYYSFSSKQQVQNMVQLTSLIINETSTLTNIITAQIVLKTIDGKPFPVSAIDSLIDANNSAVPGIIFALILLDVIYPPSFQDVHACIGTYAYESPSINTAIPYIILKDMAVSPFLNSESFATNAIRSINMNGLVTYDIESAFNSSSGLSLARLSSTNSQYAFSIKGVATYKMIGTPISLTFLSQENTKYKYTIIEHLPNIITDLVNFIGNFIYFAGLDIKCTILAVDVISRILTLDADITTSIHILPPIVYIMPFKEKILTNLGYEGYVTRSLVVGGKTASETLTVVGDASIVRELLINDPTRIGDPFHIAYSSNVFTLGTGLVVGNNLVTVQKNTVINGTIMANEYLSYSDRRIKKNIKDANGISDLELFKQIKIKDFNLKEVQSGESRIKSKLEKGVIAQDIEKLIPNMVKDKQGYIPSICRNSRVTSSGALVIHNIHMHNTSIDDVNVNIDDFKKGTKLQIKLNDSDRIVTIKRVRIKKNAMFIKISEQYPVGTIVYVRGPYGILKTINKDYLFMLCLSATQELIRKIGL